MPEPSTPIDRGKRRPACEDCKGSGRQATITTLDAPQWLPRPDTRDMIVSGVRDCPTCEGTGQR